MVKIQKPSSLLGLDKGDRIYFVGIGGYSMCGLAQICHQAGFVIAGSDREVSHRTEQLSDLGIKVFAGHEGHHLEEFKPHCVVYTSAVPKTNPELVIAEALCIPVYERSSFLGGINRMFNHVINIAGTHGKTTTTTMCALILEEAGLDPTAHIGAEVSAWKSPVRIGKSHDLFVSEACEYNSSFLQFFSTTAAILNIDHDHLDCFPTIGDVVDVFARFAFTVPSNGYLVVPSFDPHIPAMLELTRKWKHAGILVNEKSSEGSLLHGCDVSEDSVEKHVSNESIASEDSVENQVVVNDKAGESTETLDEMPTIFTFGRDSDLFNGSKPDLYSTNYSSEDGYPSFDVYLSDKFFCHLDLAVPGEHNAMNALAAIACASLNGADGMTCAAVLAQFHGADNRFSERGMYHGARIIADYAHHPSAIKVSCQAALDIAKDHKVWTVFQPITYSRAIGLFHEFTQALLQCPFSMLFEVYTSREADSSGFSSRMICEEIVKAGGDSLFLESYEELRSQLDKRVSAGDIVLVMGPDGMKKFADRLVAEEDSTIRTGREY